MLRENEFHECSESLSRLWIVGRWNVCNKSSTFWPFVSFGDECFASSLHSPSSFPFRIRLCVSGPDLTAPVSRQLPDGSRTSPLPRLGGCWGLRRFRLPDWWRSKTFSIRLRCRLFHRHLSVTKRSKNVFFSVFSTSSVLILLRQFMLTQLISDSVNCLREGQLIKTNIKSLNITKMCVDIFLRFLFLHLKFKHILLISISLP